MRLKDPSVEDLDDVLNKIVEGDLKKVEKHRHHGITKFSDSAAMIYYIGHGVEHNSHTHAVLKGDDGDKRVKYDLEKMVNRIGKHRLVHTMFDCNRVYLNHVLPQKEHVYPKKASYLYSYTTHAGRETKALNSVRTYIDHMTSQIDKDGLVLPGSVALLNGTGSINVHQANLFAVYIPLEFIVTSKFDEPEETMEEPEEEKKVEYTVIKRVEEPKEELKDLVEDVELEDEKKLPKKKSVQQTYSGFCESDSESDEDEAT